MKTHLSANPDLGKNDRLTHPWGALYCGMLFGKITTKPEECTCANCLKVLNNNRNKYADNQA